MVGIVFDIETTGLNVGEDRIIEIAAREATKGVDRSYASLVNPRCPIPESATQIHGIDDPMVEKSPLFGDVIPEFIDFCGTDTVFLIAHNGNRFDIPFLKAEFSRCGMDIPPAWKWIDTLDWSKRFRSDLPGFSLQALRETYRIPSNQAHRALDDVDVLTQLIHKMWDDLAPADVYGVLSALPTRMTFGKYKGKELKHVPDSYFAWLEREGAFEKEENAALKQALREQGRLMSKREDSQKNDRIRWNRNV